MKTATLLKTIEKPNNPGAEQAIYTLSEPLQGHTTVLVSAIPGIIRSVSLEPETYIFGFDVAADEVVEWGELDGSFRGEMNHAKALDGAGYEVTK